MFQSGMPPQARYLFKHALVQDTAYQSLLKSRRQQLHQQVAQVLVEQFPETVETQPELVAHHYTEAGSSSRPFPTGSRQGRERSSARPMWKRSAHLTKGLELLKTLPDTPERAQQELTLQVALGAPLMPPRAMQPRKWKEPTPGPESLSAGGRDSSALPGLWGLCGFYFVRGELQTARELAEELLRLAQSVQDPALLVEAHIALGSTLFCLGEFALARAILSRALLSTIPSSTALVLLSTAQDPGWCALAYAALSCGILAIRTKP